MSPFVIGILGTCGFILLMALDIPIAFSFAISGFAGIVLMKGWGTALSLLGGAPYQNASLALLLPLPLFVLMGQFAFHSGIATDLFESAARWVGRFPGGLAHATTLACTGFAACTGDGIAGTATMSTVAFPSMEQFRYNRRLSTGCIAIGGTLGVLIPPSGGFIVYGFLTETSVGKLFIAGILPGLLLSGLLMITIFIMCKRNPQLGPPVRSYSWRERLAALRGVWGMLAILILIIGGLYMGIFAPSEAGAIGAFGAFIVALSKRRITSSTLIDALKSSLQTTCIVFSIIIGAMIFNTLLSISGLSALLSKWIATLTISRYAILAIIIFVYLLMGMFMNTLSMTLLTIPTFAPILASLGFDLIWFGVVFIIMCEVGMVTPPVGINVFVVQGITKVPMEEIFRGIIPFVITMLVGVAILIIFPQIALFLPHTMG